MSQGICVQCEAPIVGRGRGAVTCSAECADVRYHARAAERGRNNRSAAKLEPRVLKTPTAWRPCSRQGCTTPVIPGHPICHAHLPRFHREPRTPRRATYFELSHATYGGQSIAAQLADTQTKSQLYHAAKARRP